MIRLVLRGLLGRKLRSVLTAISIVLGIAMISGTYVLTDQINGAFSDIFNKSYRGTDVVVTPRAAFGNPDANNSNSNNSTLYLDQSLVAQAAATPGAASTTGSLQVPGYVLANGKLIKPVGGAPPLLFSVTPPRFRPTSLVSGSYPASGQIAVDKGMAHDHHLHIGDRVFLAAPTGLVPVTISGIVSFPAATGGATLMLGTAQDLQNWYRLPGRFTQILIAAQPGVSQATLAARVAQQLHSPSVLVKTATAYAKDQAAQIANALAFLQYGLLIFGVIAAFVGGFIIFNTFSITVAQRVREFGMLRTLGATRRQVLGAVLGEAVVVAAVATLIGIVAGLGIAIAINGIFNAIGFGLPTRAAAFSGTGAVIGLIIGMGVTLIASLVPATRATRVSPIAAVRDIGRPPRSRFARYTPITAIVLGVIGLILIVQVFVTTGPVANRLLGMGVGALLFFVAVAMVTRYVVSPIARLVGAPLQRVAGVTGRLARDNAMRNPYRTAITSAALMIGVALVTFVSVFAAGAKQAIADTINGSLRGDLVIQATSGFGRIPGATVQAVARTPGIAAAAGSFSDEVRFAGSTEGVVGIDPVAFPRVWNVKWTHGSDASFATLDTNGAIIDKNLASDKKLGVGSQASIQTRSGQRHTVVIRGIYDSGNSPINGILIPLDLFRQLSTNTDTDVVLAATAPGADVNSVEAAVRQALAQFPLAQVQTRSAYTSSTQATLDPILYLFYALLSMSVVISLFGIVNTLVLSIFERTREIGMLRAIGLSRRQTRRMIRYESVITTLIGGLLGLAVGLFFGFVVTTGLKSQGLVFAVPTTQLVVFLILAIIAGIVSAVFPARRAARLNVLAALQYE